MSVAEFGLRSQISFMSMLPQMRLALSAGSEAQIRCYEASLRFLQSELDLKSARLRLLLDLTNGVVARGEINDLLREVTIGSRRLMQSDFAILPLLDSQRGQLPVHPSQFSA